MKKIKLRNIASVRFGLNSKTSDKKGVPFITARDITAIGEIDWSSVLNTTVNQVSAKDFLIDGEVLFAAKGNRNKAVTWRGENNSAIASSTFMVISLNSTEILPEYLSLYLESAKAKAHFTKHTRASTIPTIKKGTLLDLDIEMPDLKRQQSIIELSRLTNEEAKLMLELIEKKQRLVYALF